MDDLRITDTVRVPASALSFKAVRAGGPGGQNVNKVASKVELRLDMDAIEGLPEDALLRLRVAVRNQLDAEGRWLVVSSRTRDQAKNLDDARNKIVSVVVMALVRPKARRPTRPSKGSQERRLEGKRRDASVKKTRRGDFD